MDKYFGMRIIEQKVELSATNRADAEKEVEALNKMDSGGVWQKYPYHLCIVRND